MTPIEVAFLVFDVVFIIIAIFLIKFLKNASCTLQQTTRTVEAIHQQLDDLGHEPKELVHRVNEISADIQNKMKCVDPLFRALSNVGEGIECRSLAYRDAAFCRCCGAKLPSKDSSPGNSQESSVIQCINLAIAAATLWQDLKKRR
jgi:uncharacterized protein YoxC